MSPSGIEEARGLVASGNFGPAEMLLRQILSDQQTNPEALTLLGITLMRTGRADEAGDSLSAALSEQGENAEALTWLAALRHGQRRHEDAVSLIDRLLRLTPDNVEALNLLGNCYLALGKAAEAEAAFRSAISFNQEIAASFANLGMALRLQNRGEEALEMFRSAVTLSPDHARNYLQVFKQLQQLSRCDEAVAELERGLARHPGSVELSEALALALGRLNRGAEAETIFRRIASATSSTANSYATWLQDEGRFVEAARVLEQSLTQRPIQGAPYRILAEAKFFELGGEPILDKMLAVTAEPKLDATERMHLSYAFGKVYEHGKAYEAAMQAYGMANELAYGIYSNSRTFDPSRTARDPELAAQLYTREFFERFRAVGSNDARPIFIVGMIRSGTTLLERVVSSHPDVHSVGEPTFWNVEADAIHPRWMEADPSEPEIAALALRYLESIRIGSIGRKFTDKMPLNYRHLGLIHAVFPQARILHIRRDPFDTCLSIYTTFFGGGPNFTYNRQNIVSFYRAYLGFMAHWRSALPAESFLEVDYESLVADPEPHVREVLGFLGLDWNDSCLHHDQNRSQVTTPSRWQVRQPIYTASVGKREIYGAFVPEFTEL